MGLSVLFGFVVPFALASFLVLLALPIQEWFPSSHASRVFMDIGLVLGWVPEAPFLLASKIWPGLCEGEGWQVWLQFVVTSMVGWLIIGAIIGGAIIAYRMLWGSKPG